MRLSVVLCTYNGAAYLRPQLDSLLAQTLLPDEILIHDDGSTDDTLAIAREYAARHPFIRIVSHAAPHGINPNFFAALQAAQGEYIAICDQDDLWEPTKLEKQMAALQTAQAAHPEAALPLLCACLSRPFSDDGRPVNADSRPANLSPLRMMYVGMIPGHTMLIHRSLLSYVPRGLFFMYDLQLQIAAALLGSLVVVPEVLVHQRRHPQASTYLAPQSKLQMLHLALASYGKLRPQVRRRFHEWELFLASPEAQALPVPAEVENMVCLQQGRGLLNYLRLTCFCLRHRHDILPTTDIRGLRAILFALAFPLTCVNYYRYFLNSK